MSGTLRVEIDRFFAAHVRSWELFMALLAITSVVIGVLVVEGLGPSELIVIEYGLTALFCIEYGVRLWAAPNRLQYLRGHWIDLISIIPPIRGARLLRLLRLLRVASELSRLVSQSRLSAQRKVIVRVALFWLAVVIISAIGMYLAEQAENENVNSVFDSLWWAIVTITTVGYGDVSPVTVEGRLAAGVLMVLGIVLFSFLTAALTSALTSPQENARSVTLRLQELEGLRAQSLVSTQEYEEFRTRLLKEL